MKAVAVVTLVSFLLGTEVNAFSPSSTLQQQQQYNAVLSMTNNNKESDSCTSQANIDRRSLLTKTATLLTTAAIPAVLTTPIPAFAVEPSTIVVAGATGQTGRTILERLAARPGTTVIGGVRNVD